LREVERFAPAALRAANARDLLPERFDLNLADGKPMITRTEVTRFLGKPRLRPISSGEGTRLVMRYESMQAL
jgi:hypothetical protein